MRAIGGVLALVLLSTFALVPALGGCRDKANATPAPAASSVAAPVASAPSPSPSRPPAPVPYDDGPLPAACRPYAEAMSAGRKATIEKRYDDALVAFDDAQYTVPFDAPAWAERGYAKLLAGRPLEAIDDLRFAAIAGDEATLPSVHFNLGMAYEQAAGLVLSKEQREEIGPMHSRPALLERSRAHFAVALRKGNAAALPKLGARSHCTVARYTTGLEDAKLASSWRDVAKTFEIDPAPATEAEAKKALCAPFDTNTYAVDTSKDACGAPVVGKRIEIAVGYMNFTALRRHYLPLPGNRFFADGDFTAGGACRRGNESYDLALRDGAIERTVRSVDVRFVNRGRRDEASFWRDLNAQQEPRDKVCPRLTGAKNDGDFSCTVGKQTAVSYWDARTGRALLRLEPLLDTDDEKPRAAIADGKVTITGASECTEPFALGAIAP